MRGWGWLGQISPTVSTNTVSHIKRRYWLGGSSCKTPKRMRESWRASLTLTYSHSHLHSHSHSSAPGLSLGLPIDDRCVVQKVQLTDVVSWNGRALPASIPSSSCLSPIQVVRWSSNVTSWLHYWTSSATGRKKEASKQYGPTPCRHSRTSSSRNPASRLQALEFATTIANLR